MTVYNDTITAPKLAHTTVLKSIGRFETIALVSIQVSLTSLDEAETLLFSPVWKVPLPLLELSSERFSLNNVSFLVADGDFASEDLLIGNPVLHHLQIHSDTL